MLVSPAPNWNWDEEFPAHTIHHSNNVSPHFKCSAFTFSRECNDVLKDHLTSQERKHNIAPPFQTHADVVCLLVITYTSTEIHYVRLVDRGPSYSRCDLARKHVRLKVSVSQIIRWNEPRWLWCIFCFRMKSFCNYKTDAHYFCTDIRGPQRMCPN